MWERWIAFSTEPLYLALFARWDPGMIVRRHGHHSPHTLIVLEGSVTCDGVECGPGTHIELPHGAGFGPFVAGPDGPRRLRGDDGRPPLVERRARGHGRRAGRARGHAAARPAHRAARRARGPAGACSAPTRQTDGHGCHPRGARAPRHHLGRRPRHGAQGPVAARAAGVAARPRAPKVVREKVKLEFNGGHYGFERNVADGQWCDLWLFDDLVVPTGLLHAPAGMPRERAAQRPRHLRGLPPGHLRPGRAPRRHDAEPRRGGHQLPQHLPPLRRPGLRRAGRQGPRARLPAHLQRLDDRRVVRRAPGRVASSRSRSCRCGTRSSRPRRCGAARRRAATPSPSPRTRRSSACPSMYTGEWDVLWQACEETDTTVSMHIGSSSSMPTTSRRRAARHLDVALRPERPGLAVRLGLLGHARSASRTLKIAYAESQVGWMPFQLERMDAVWRDGRRRRRAASIAARASR